MKQTNIPDKKRELEKLKFDLQAKYDGAIIKDYDIYKRSFYTECVLIVIALCVYFLAGFVIAWIMYGAGF